MESHIHLSIFSVLGTAAIVIIAEFFLKYASVAMAASTNPNIQRWGAAFSWFA